MRRIWIVTGTVVTVAAAAVAYQLSKHWKDYHYVGTRLMVDISQPDALIRTTSLSKLPRDLLQVPIAKDVLTEDLAFYYEQNEDRLGLNGAVKRIAYEHELDWQDKLYASIFNEPAEVAFWRDGKGALRHYAVVMRMGLFNKALQEAAKVAMKDGQLKLAGDISTSNGKAQIMALEVNPRRTLLLISQGDRVVVLSDPGLLFDDKNGVVTEARAAVANWLEHDGALSLQFDLDSIAPAPAQPASTAKHTLAIGAPTMALGYGAFVSGFKGMRFDFGGNWSTSVWLDSKKTSSAQLLDPALWTAAPANPSACITVPIDWTMVNTVLKQADAKPKLPEQALAPLSGPGLACWYRESNLYSPVFITKLPLNTANRDATLQAMATWAIASGEQAAPGKGTTRAKPDQKLWRNTKSMATLAASGDFVVFSPDGGLVEKVVDTIARSNPSVADQTSGAQSTLGLITPRPLSEMAQREIYAALAKPEDASFLEAAKTHLPARIKALATYPPIRLELSKAQASGKAWQKVEWVSKEKSN
ncbi:hypothetical protein UNDYM_1717 [Undibacterium sp. YM2]|uniref:DUF2138 family protein n=1 Tax=Undibacterium sp. YM2 TaxID=2058625 RepID=UPI001331F838|nr:DUF2138 family protein [Undibacterium sp. YM2]BBB65970.1 hypothetical protein UNDYM_1717 [Undibacterium sp. YM2]